MTDADRAAHRADLAVLAAEYPAWRIGSTWRSAETGTDHRNLTATRSDGVMVAAPNAAMLREKIRHEEASE